MSRALRLLGLAGASLLSACGAASDVFGEVNPPFRYRLTAIVDTPEGQRTGSSVIQLQWPFGGKGVGTLQGGGISYNGEAPVVDLPGGRKLFVLLSKEGDYDWAPWSLRGVFRNFTNPVDEPRTVRRLPRRARGTPGSTVDNRPDMGTFGDLSDPASLRQVDPDDLAAAFGKGYALKGLTVQLTDAPVTSGIKKVLPWLSPGAGALTVPPRGVGRADMPFSSKIIHGDFSRNDYR